MENHYFNINIATKYGVNCAIVLQNICYWIDKNKENAKNFFDGRYWTHNPIKEFKVQFPYLTERQIRTALDTLKDEGIVLTANYNKTCDRTLWYTVTQKAIDIMNNNQDKQAQEDFSNEESIAKVDANLLEIRSQEDICQNETSSKSIHNDVQVNTYCHTSQYEMTPVSNDTNNKPQIINTNKLEKEIYKEKETPDRVIFDLWNSKPLIKSPEINKKTRAVIATVLKSFTLEQVVLAIKRYSQVYESKNYFNHAWDLDSFLSGAAVRKFLDNGTHWVNYCNWLREHDSKQGFIHNNYTSKQINDCICNLEELEV